jgi:hypothetical protein
MQCAMVGIARDSTRVVDRDAMVLRMQHSIVDPDSDSES